jgi:hypothetical protein
VLSAAPHGLSIRACEISALVNCMTSSPHRLMVVGEAEMMRQTPETGQMPSCSQQIIICQPFHHVMQVLEGLLTNGYAAVKWAATQSPAAYPLLKVRVVPTLTFLQWCPINNAQSAGVRYCMISGAHDASV